MVLPRDIKGFERPRHGIRNIASRSQGRGPVSRHWGARFEYLRNGQCVCSGTGGPCLTLDAGSRAVDADIAAPCL